MARRRKAKAPPSVVEIGEAIMREAPAFPVPYVECQLCGAEFHGWSCTECSEPVDTSRYQK